MAEGTHQEVDGAGEDAGEHELEGQRHQALGYEERRVVVEAVADLPPQQRLLGVPAARPASSAQRKLLYGAACCVQKLKFPTSNATHEQSWLQLIMAPDVPRLACSLLAQL